MNRLHLLSVTSSVAVSLGAAAFGAEATAWLGAQIGPVPRPLDAHLLLNGRGAMVLNVAKDSPADKSGLERFDVVLKFGQDDVTSVDRFIDQVGRSQAGSKVTLRIIHEGKEQDVQVTLSAPPSGRPEYKYEPLPDGLLDDRWDVRGKVFRRTPHGWRMEDLGEFDDLPRLPDGMMPRFKQRHGQYWLDDTRKSVTKFKAHVSREGKTIDISGGADGHIVVTRSPGKDGTPQTVVYARPDDLQRADPEAYKVYLDAIGKSEDGGLSRSPTSQEARPPYPRERYREWMKDLADRLPSFDRRRLNDLLDDLKKDWGPELDAAKKQILELEKKVQDQIDRLYRSQERKPDSEGGVAGTEPSTRFEVAADGKMTVHLRDGDKVLTLHFDNVDQLKAKRPDLYQKYEAMEKKR